MLSKAAPSLSRLVIGFVAILLVAYILLPPGASGQRRTGQGSSTQSAKPKSDLQEFKETKTWYLYFKVTVKGQENNSNVEGGGYESISWKVDDTYSGSVGLDFRSPFTKQVVVTPQMSRHDQMAAVISQIDRLFQWTHVPSAVMQRAALFIAAMAQVAQRVPAQYTDSMGGGFNNPISAQMSTMLWNRIFYPKASGISSKSAPSSSTGTSAPRTQAAPSKTANESALRFRPIGTHISTRKLADLLGNTPAEREQYLKLMNAVLDGFDQKVKPAGLQNDIAIALSYFLAENARIYHGAPELSDQQYVDIRNVIAEALVTLDALGSITDRSKQEFYEGLVAYTGITQFGYEQSKQAGNDEMAKLYQKVAGQNLQTVTRMSPDEINVDPSGLSVAGGSRSFRPADSDQGHGPATGGPIAVDQLSHDYYENTVRADEIYKGRKFVFTGTVVGVSSDYYRSIPGQRASMNLGTNLRLTRGGTVGGFEVYCFFKDNRQLAQLRSEQKITFEATVQGKEEGSATVILNNGVLR
jgi:hypothetical protein